MSQRQPGTAQDFDAAFFKYVYGLVASAYNPDDAVPEPVLKLPPAKARSAANPVVPSTFQSKIADLRLRRMQERIDALHVEANNQAKAACESYSQMLHSNAPVEIEEVFKPEKAKRRNYPLYLENAERDRSAAKWRPKEQPPRVPLEEINRKFSNRLEEAKERGSARAHNRMARRSGASSAAGSTSLSSTPK
jgi:hypothetical protein